MYIENYSEEEKKIISKKIKNISLEEIKNEYQQLKVIGKDACNKSERCRIGNKIVDYFTFKERLYTRGKYNVNYYEFIANLDDFKKKKFISNMITYYDNVKNKNKTKNEYIVLKEIYNICISSINIIRPLVYMEVYSKYIPSCILDFCAGWGGACVAASALNIPKYIGIDINTTLIEPYNKLCNFLNDYSNTKIEMIFEDALNVDYSKMNYDLVFTSTPYYFIQKYKNNKEYVNKKEMDNEFYIPIFKKTYEYLKKGGYYILNVNKEIYDNVCVKVLGEAHDSFPYKKSKRQNDYKEMVYVWKK